MTGKPAGVYRIAFCSAIPAVNSRWFSSVTPVNECD
jgi:hypothetical protein